MSPSSLACALTCLVALHAGSITALPAGSRLSTDALVTDHAVGYYDERLRRVVIAGAAGDPGPDDRDAVWSWSGTRWDRKPGEGPPGRVNAAAAFARRRGAAIVTGGSRKAADGTWAVVADSWIGDGKGWTRLADIPARDHHALVEDGDGGVLLFGGIPARRSDPWPADTWTLTGDRWTRLATEGPAARGRTALAYDARRRQVVLFGGVSAPPGPDQPQTFLADTWVWEASRWRKVADGRPRGRYAHGMAFDERRGVVLLYGGAAAHKGAPPPRPVAMGRHALDRDCARGTDTRRPLSARYGLRPRARRDGPLRWDWRAGRHVGVERPRLAARVLALTAGPTWPAGRG